MDCNQAQEQILEALAESGALMPLELESHLSDCADCRGFSQTQLLLDAQLRTAIAAPVLSAAFRKSLMKKVRSEPVSAWPGFLPDIAHVAGCAAAMILCLWLLPFAAGPVLLAGSAVTLATWFAQSLIRSVTELRDDDYAA